MYPLVFWPMLPNVLLLSDCGDCMLVKAFAADLDVKMFGGSSFAPLVGDVYLI